MRLNQKRALAEADAFQMKEAPPGLAERGFRFAILRLLTNGSTRRQNHIPSPLRAL
jgi:hypothetical protein